MSELCHKEGQGSRMVPDRYGKSGYMGDGARGDRAAIDDL